MIVLAQLPLRWNYVAPLNLALLKAFLEQKGLETKVVDFSPNYNEKFVEIVRKKKVEDEELAECYLRASAINSTILRYVVRKVALRRAWSKVIYPLYLVDKEEGAFDEVDNSIYEVYSEIADNIMDCSPSLVGFSTDVFSIGHSLNVAKILKEERKDLKIIFGGPGTLYGWKFLLKYDFIDHIIVGEGEYALLKIADGLRDRVIFSNEFLVNLNNLPTPDYTDLDTGKYCFLGVETQRGCVNRCRFCNIRTFPCGEMYREKDIEKVLEEIRELKSIKNRFFFCDNIVNPYPKRTKELCRGLAELEVEWEGMMFPRIDRETAFLIKKSGCRRVWLGVESFDTKDLKILGKNVTEREVIDSVKNLSEAGVDVDVQLLFLFPKTTFLGALRTILRTFLLQKYIGEIDANYFYLAYNCDVHRNPESYDVEIMEDELSPIVNNVPFVMNNKLQNTLVVILTAMLKRYFSIKGKTLDKKIKAETRRFPLTS